MLEIFNGKSEKDFCNYLVVDIFPNRNCKLTSDEVMVESNLIRKHYNFTGKQEDENQESVASKVVFIIVCCFIILENTLVLLIIWKKKNFHKPMFYFIGNLAFSDMLAGTVYITNILLSGHITFQLTSTQWFIREGSMFVILAASVFNLLAIAVERYVTMLKMKLQSGGNTWHIFLLISTCWIIAAILGSMPIMGWNCINNITTCSTVLPLYKKSYILFCISIFTLILFAIVILYIRIYGLVYSRSRNLVFYKDSSNHSSKPPEKSVALLRTVIIVLSCFIIFWTPLFIILAVDVASETGKCQILHEMKWFLTLAVVNSAMNPLIYMFTSKQIRTAFLQLLPCASCMWPNGKPIIAIKFSHSKSDSSHPKGQDRNESMGDPTSLS
ncbi:sphingosine 1-phosphate receptor 1-like [Arapaima gigas]